MLSFWNWFGNENKIKIEDPEKGIYIEAQEKNFSGTVNGMKIQASFKSFQVQGENGIPSSFLSFMNPFAFLNQSVKKESLEDHSKDS